MKKLFVCLVILTLLVGCKDTNNNVKENNNKDNNEIKRPEVISGYTYLDNIKCDAFKEDIKYLNYDDTYKIRSSLMLFILKRWKMVILGYMIRIIIY